MGGEEAVRRTLTRLLAPETEKARSQVRESQALTLVAAVLIALISSP